MTENRPLSPAELRELEQDFTGVQGVGGLLRAIRELIALREQIERAAAKFPFTMKELDKYARLRKAAGELLEAAEREDTRNHYFHVHELEIENVRAALAEGETHGE